MNLTPELGLRMAQGALEARGGVLPDELTLLVYLIGADAVENPASRGDPGTNAMAKFFGEKGVPVFGLVFDPEVYEQWRKNRPDSAETRQEWSEFFWTRIPDDEEFCAGLRFKQKWTGSRWENIS